MKRASEPDGDASQWAKPETVTQVFVYFASNESRESTAGAFSPNNLPLLDSSREL